MRLSLLIEAVYQRDKSGLSKRMFEEGKNDGIVPKVALRTQNLEGARYLRLYAVARLQVCPYFRAAFTELVKEQGHSISIGLEEMVELDKRAEELSKE